MNIPVFPMLTNNVLSIWVYYSGHEVASHLKLAFLLWLMMLNVFSCAFSHANFFFGELSFQLLLILNWVVLLFTWRGLTYPGYKYVFTRNICVYFLRMIAHFLFLMDVFWNTKGTKLLVLMKSIFFKIFSWIMLLV